VSGSGQILFVRELLNALRVASEDLTGIVREVAQSLGLDPDVEVTVSLRRFTEAGFEGEREGEVVLTEVCGYYDPEDRRIILSYPCIAERSGWYIDVALRTLAHELIHHCQYTCTTGSCRSICEERLSISNTRRVRDVLPYRLKPYEIEAYTKQSMLAEEVGRRWGKEIEPVIKGLDTVLRPQLEPAIKWFAERLELWGYELFNYVINMLVDKVVGRDTLEREVGSIDKLLERYKLSLLGQCKETQITSITFTPTRVGNRSKPKVIIATNSGFALASILDAGTSIATLELKPSKQLTLSETLKKISVPRIIYGEFQTDDLKASLYSDKDEEKVLMEIANQVCGSRKEFCETLEGLICALTLVGAVKEAVIERVKVSSSNVELIRVKSSMGDSSASEVLLCGDRMRLGDRELDKVDVIKAILNPGTVNRDFAEALRKCVILNIENIEKLKKELEELEKELKELELKVKKELEIEFEVKEH
jgi:hypothetical protein